MRGATAILALIAVWLGVVTVLRGGGDFAAAIESPLFALGTGALLLMLCVLKLSLRRKPSPIAAGLGSVVTAIYVPAYALNLPLPFVPVLLFIFGAAIVVGAVRAGKYFRETTL